MPWVADGVREASGEGGASVSKSRYSKTKAAGLMCGMSRHKQEFKSRMAGPVVIPENRQIRRMRKREAAS